MQIYLARNQVQAGPYTLDQINNMLATEQVDFSDLMWHEGMDQWKTVGEMTQGQRFYNPNNSASVTPTTAAPKRVSVAELYGKKEPSAGVTKDQIERSPTPSNFSANPKLNKVKPINPTGTDQLATISNRVLAVIIDSLLLMACYLPFLSGIGYDVDKIYDTAGNMDQMTQLVQSVPEHLSLMTSLLTLALFVVQLVLLIKRGQTLGKLITGIRIVNSETKKLASFTNVVLLRSIMTSILYSLPLVGTFFLIADFMVMVLNKQRRSIHDRYAKTLVLKADPDQLQK